MNHRGHWLAMFCLLGLLTGCAAPSATPMPTPAPVTWTRAFTGPDYGAFLGLTLTPDSTILAVGATEHLHFPPYEGDALLMKVSLEGEVLWEQTWGGDGYEQAWDATPAAGGGYYVFGETDSIGAGGRDFFLMKTDEQGAEEWVRTYGRPGREWPYGMLPLANGDLLLYGFSEDDAGVRRPYAVRVSPDGALIWEYLPDGQVDELVLDALEVDGDLVLAVNIEEDGKLVKLDGDGDLLWETRYELPGWQYASRLAPADGDGFLMAGFALVGGQADTWLARAGGDGELLWETTFGDPQTDDYTHAMIPLRDGTYLLGLIADGMQIVRVDGQGSILWQRALVGPEIYGSMALEELDDGFLVAGLIQIVGGRSYDALLLRTDPFGQLGD